LLAASKGVCNAICDGNPALNQYGVISYICEALLSVNIHVVVLWVMTPWNLVDVCSPPTRLHDTHPELPNVL